jgi:tripartite-type tricarboxylate transporter receptor subunit TctC
MPFVQSGKVTGLAILAPQRSRDLPNVPTMEEAGVTGLNVDSWIGLFAPAGTPKAIIQNLQAAVETAAPQLKDKFAGSGAEYMWIQPDQLDGFVGTEYKKWTKIIKDAGITLQ